MVMNVVRGRVGTILLSTNGENSKDGQLTTAYPGQVQSHFSTGNSVAFDVTKIIFFVRIECKRIISDGAIPF